MRYVGALHVACKDIAAEDSTLEQKKHRDTWEEEQEQEQEEQEEEGKGGFTHAQSLYSSAARTIILLKKRKSLLASAADAFTSSSWPS